MNLQIPDHQRYIDLEAQQAKRTDWNKVAEYLHALIDSIGLERGDGRGAYTLYFRISTLLDEIRQLRESVSAYQSGTHTKMLREARAAIRAHVDECNDQLCAGESVPDFNALQVWLRKSDRLKLD